MTRCLAEMCGNWTGDGCACRVFGIEPQDVSEPSLPWPYDLLGCECDADPCLCGTTQRGASEAVGGSRNE